MKDLRDFSTTDISDLVNGVIYKDLQRKGLLNYKEQKKTDEDFFLDEIEEEELPEDIEEIIVGKKVKTSKFKVSRIVDGKVILRNDENSSKHTVESKKKLSEARRSRKVQPREGTSKKSQTFASEMQKDYKSYVKSYKEVDKFLKKNKDKFYKTKEETEQAGILTEYHYSQHGFSEIGVQQVLFDPSAEPNTSFENNIDYELDFIIFMDDLTNTLERMKEDGLSPLFIETYSRVKKQYFDLDYKDDFLSKGHLVLQTKIEIEKEYGEVIGSLLIEEGVLDF